MIRWRYSNKLSLVQMARLLGMLPHAAGHLSRLERGQIWISPQLAMRMYYVTLAIGPKAVTLEDHLAAWRQFHPQLSSDLRKVSRYAARVHMKAAATRNGTNGSKKGKRRGEEKDRSQKGRRTRRREVSPAREEG